MKGDDVFIFTNFDFTIQGDVLIFLDSHMECAPGWLEPILSRIASDRSVIAVPNTDRISPDDMAYIRDKEQTFGFDWNLLYKWY